MLVWKIPDEARRVVEYNVEDKKHKGNSIYCQPFRETGGVIKIIPGERQNAEVQLLKEKQLPRDDCESGAFVNDKEFVYIT